MTSLTRDERQSRIEELKRWFEDQNEEFRDDGFPPEVQAAWDQNTAEIQDHEKILANLQQRDERMKQMAKDGTGQVESGDGRSIWQDHRAPQLVSRMTERDVYDLSAVRVDPFNPGAPNAELINRARRAAEISFYPAAGRNQEDAQDHVDELLRRGDGEDWQASEVARRILATGSPAYKRGFAKLVVASLRGTPGVATLTHEEQKAVERAPMAVGVGSTGGFAVPFQLDPTVVPTSNLSVNPFRAISRVVNLSGTNEWRGVTSAGVTASYATEAAPASDNSPTLAQPPFVVKRAQCFVPVSIELTQDWGGLQSELASLIQDAKDDLEATKFTTGTGTNEPKGIITAATTSPVNMGTTLVIAYNDLYAVENALGPRFRPRAQWVGNRAIYNKVRALDSAAGAGAQWVPSVQSGLANNVPRPGNTGYTLIGYPANEDSAMASAIAAAAKVLILGDFRYYVIVERIGMDIELIPHIFDTATGFPKGQRGVYAFWRNHADVIDPNAFRVMLGI